MRIRAALWLAMAVSSWAACSYEPPKVEELQYRCDAAHGCPPGQACKGGFCGNPNLGEIGVACGDALCGSPSRCCHDIFSEAPRCISSDASCLYTVGCDGPEDCSGQLCCASGSTTKCEASCSSQRVCVTSDDCPDSAKQCCPAPVGPYKVCQSFSC